MSQSHIYTVASGFGLRVVPVDAPYEFRLGPEPHDLDVERWDNGRRLIARITPGKGGGYSSNVGEDARSLDDVADIMAGPALDRWWLETSVYRVPLPKRWRAVAERAPQSAMFDLVGPDGSLIFIQTPRKVPDPSWLVAPGQQLHGHGRGERSRWIEVRYHHEAQAWAQRHDVVELDGVTCVVTAQCPVTSLSSIATTRQAVVAGITRA